ncbi:MAG: hypothetical protein H7174_02455, partial [Flavobacterium sp.]|nr:hypothetical protein [Flavobacterium sp.]
MKILYIFLLSNLTVWSQSDVPLTLRDQFNGSYGYIIIGNTLNEFDNRFDNPPPPCQVLTQSSAILNLMPNQNVVKAFLYWSGVENGNSNPVVTLNGNNYTASNTCVSFPENNLMVKYFGSLVDVTSQVIATGNGIYNLSNFDLNPYLGNYCGGGVQYAGWHILVIYNDATLPNNQLNIYDGLNVVSTYFNNGITPLTISNLNVVDSQNAAITFVAYNGSSNLFANESITFNGSTLSNALNPLNNPFNGTNSFTGSTTNWNQDIDTFDITNFVNIGDTQATINFNSSFYRFIQTLVTSIRSELPDVTVQINQITGQQTCNNRDLVVNYTVANTNSNADLPSNVPVSFYANNILLQTVNTTASVAIGGSLSLQATITIPASIPNTFDLKVVVDNSSTGTSTVAESNENNNESVQSITLSGVTITPTFNTIPAFCSGATAPVLPTTSLNNISGTWSPATVNNTTGAMYTFTPTTGQCAANTTLTTIVTANITPTFNTIPAFCSGATAPVLPTTSLNNISGTWSPATVNNLIAGTYTFTPTTGQCATSITLTTIVT